MRTNWPKLAGLAQKFEIPAVFSFVSVFISLKDHSCQNLLLFAHMTQITCTGMTSGKRRLINYQHCCINRFSSVNYSNSTLHGYLSCILMLLVVFCLF